MNKINDGEIINNQSFEAPKPAPEGNTPSQHLHRTAKMTAHIFIQVSFRPFLKRMFFNKILNQIKFINLFNGNLKNVKLNEKFCKLGVMWLICQLRSLLLN